MTPTLLQDCLTKEIKTLFDGFLLKNVKEEPSPINVYPQFLPAKNGEEDEEYFPYIIIRVQEGEEDIQEDPALCNIAIVVGVYDWNDNYQGYKDVMNILEKMRQHFLTQRILDHRFEIQGKLKWAVNEEDVYPYFFGGLECSWNIGKPSMEEKEV